MRDKKGVDLDRRRGGKELGEVEGGETVIRICYERKEAIFNKMKEKKKDLMFQEVHVAFNSLTHCAVISSKFFSIPFFLP